MAQRQIISRIPHKGMTGEEWGLVIQNELLELWQAAMTADERRTWEKSQASPAMFRKFDEIVLHQAQTLGWRIALSEVVRLRMSEWDNEASGPDKFEKLGRAWAHTARILQRRELPPIEDPDQWAVKNETVRELRIVLEELRATFAIRRTALSTDEVHKQFAVVVSEAPGSLPHLSANLERWQKFFEENPDTLQPMSLGDRIKPASLYDEFLSFCTGWQPDSVRQVISRLKP